MNDHDHVHVRPGRGERFSTVVADPPWPYATPGKGPLQSSKEHRPKSYDYSRNGATAGSSARSRYGLMKLEEIKALPVEQHVGANAHLYLWTTNAFVVQAHEVAAAWGFRPVTLLTWVKVKPGTAEPSMKTGYYFRGATEHAVFAVRGSLRLRTKRGISTAFVHPRTELRVLESRGSRATARRSHSVKPDAFFDLVRKCSPGPYLEMFARRPRQGWSVWGNEVESDFRFEDGSK